MKDNQLVPVTNMDIKLSDARLSVLARETGFIQRVRKFNPVDFIRSVCIMALYATISLEIFATVLGLVAGSQISKQSVWEKITPRCVAFMRFVLVALTLRSSHLQPLKQKGALSFFRRVFLQDSTNLNLPRSLVDRFPGASNQTGKKSATLKLQVIHELLSESYLHFGLSGFTRNDQSASADILTFVKAGDLILRDLGYFSLKVFRLLIDKGAYFLTPYCHRVNLYTLDGKKIDLLKLLKHHPFVDINVFAGAEDRLPVRLIACPVPATIAQVRRRKLLEKRNHGLKPKKEKLKLLGWDILLTNVSQQIWDAQTACKVYGLRWRIEIIFKSWKSYFHLDSLPEKGNQNYIELLVYSRLLFITLFQSFFVEFNEYAYATSGKPLSVLKVAQFIQHHLWALVLALFSSHMAWLVLEQIIKHCTYETRHKRKNFHEKLSKLLT